MRLRSFLSTLGPLVEAMIHTASPHARQVSMSMPKTRFWRCAGLIVARRMAGVSASGPTTAAGRLHRRYASNLARHRRAAPYPAPLASPGRYCRFRNALRPAGAAHATGASDRKTAPGAASRSPGLDSSPVAVDDDMSGPDALASPIGSDVVLRTEINGIGKAMANYMPASGDMKRGHGRTSTAKTMLRDEGG